MAALTRTLVAVVALAGCRVPTAPEHQTQNVTVIIGPVPSPSPSPVPSPAPGCQPVAEVVVSVLGEADARFPLGTETLDATPRDASGNELDRNCHGSVVVWTRAGSASCALTGNISGFNPQLTCSSPGTVTVTASVSHPGGTGTAVFVVE